MTTLAPLDPEQKRVVERTYKDFVRSGALLSDADKEKLKALNKEEIAAHERVPQQGAGGHQRSAPSWSMTCTTLDGLSDSDIAAAAAAAKTRGLEGKWVLTLQNTTQHRRRPTSRIALCAKSSTRRRSSRGIHGGDNDTTAIVTRLAQLRAQRAKLLGYTTYAAYTLEDQMAKTPDNAHQADDRHGPGDEREGARGSGAHAEADRQPIRRLQLQPWDWQYYAEQVRRADYDLDENAGAAVLRARSRAARRRLLRRHQVVRHHVQGAEGHPRLSGRRARVRSLRQRRQAARALLRRPRSRGRTSRAAHGRTRLSASRSCSGRRP